MFTRPGVVCRSGATWDKQHGVDVERQRLLTQTRDLVNKGLQADHLWHTATHADYARPMLQVSLLFYAFAVLCCISWKDAQARAGTCHAYVPPHNLPNLCLLS